MPQSKYDTYSSGSSEQQNENYELIVGPEVTIESEIARAFGSDSEFGQSLGVVRQDVELIDGCMYYDADKDKYKLFSWADVHMSPGDALDRGQTLSADDADETISRTYVSHNKTYDLIAARVEPVLDEDGEVVVPASSKWRSVDRDADGLAFTDFEEGDEPVEIGFEAITWYDGSDEYGPSASAKDAAQTLTNYGDNAVLDEDDNYNWLIDTSGENILRDDLEGRRIEEFMVIRESENGFNYHDPVFLDADTGVEIQADNRSESDDTGDSGNESGSALVESTGAMPEPVASFVESGSSLELDTDRAGGLLDEMIEDPDTNLTPEMVEEAGGREAVIQQVV